jgi:hypothetical protein
VVAADLLEISRGDTVDILDSVDVPDPSDNSKKERWFRVRARDAESTEGWVEARNIMAEEVLAKSRKLAEDDKGTQAQATGQLHAGSNLRLSPERSNAEHHDEARQRLQFEIIGWTRVPKLKGAETSKSDAPRPSQARPAKQKETTGKPGTLRRQSSGTVRLSPSISPAPEGWIFGKQVELMVPSDIIYYRTGREFVAWRRLDEDTTDEPPPKRKMKDSRPGSWDPGKEFTKEPHRSASRISIEFMCWVTRNMIRITTRPIVVRMWKAIYLFGSTAKPQTRPLRCE